MAINPMVPLVVWSGNGSANSTSLSVSGEPLVFLSPGELIVQQRIVASGDVSALANGVDFDLSGYPVTSSSDTPATITRIGGALPSGYTWVVTRETPASQVVDLQQGGDFSSQDIEAIGNRLALMIQEDREKLARAFLLSVFSAGVSAEFPAPSALALLRWNAGATALENAVGVDLSENLVSSFMATLLDAANAAAARTTLGLGTAATLSPSAYIQTLLPAASAAAARTTLGLGSIAVRDSSDFVNSFLEDGTADAVQASLGLTGFQQVNGLVIKPNASVPTTSLDVTWTSGFIGRPIGAATVTINAAANGAVNRLDAGSLANAVWYAVFIIHDPVNNLTGGLLSTSGTAPTLPANYTLKCRVGWVKTGGAATFLRTLQKGKRAVYTPVSGSTTTALPIMISGTSGNPTSGPTLTAVSVSAYVPTTATEIDVLLQVNNGHAIASPNADYGISGSTTLPVHLERSSTEVNSQRRFLLETSDVYYASNAAASLLACIGWIDATPCS